MTPAQIAAAFAAIAELLVLIMRRYGTDDPAEAARRMTEAMRYQDDLAARAKAKHAERRKAGA